MRIEPRLHYSARANKIHRRGDREAIAIGGKVPVTTAGQQQQGQHPLLEPEDASARQGPSAASLLRVREGPSRQDYIARST